MSYNERFNSDKKFCDDSVDIGEHTKWPEW